MKKQKKKDRNFFLHKNPSESSAHRLTLHDKKKYIVRFYIFFMFFFMIFLLWNIRHILTSTCVNDEKRDEKKATYPNRANCPILSNIQNWSVGEFFLSL